MPKIRRNYLPDTTGGGDDMDCGEYVSQVALPTRAEISAEARLVYGMLRPKMEEAEANLRQKDPRDGHDSENKGGVCYPRPAPSQQAWSGAFCQALDGKDCNLTYAEQLALKMVNYMVYTECSYADVVNRVCYVLANANKPKRFEVMRCRKTMESITRDARLKHKVNFLKDNLPCIENDIPDITEYCNIDLRNMIAHGNLAGDPRPAQPWHNDMSVYVKRNNKGKWVWAKKPVNLDDAFDSMRKGTLVWHHALLQGYADFKIQ